MRKKILSLVLAGFILMMSAPLAMADESGSGSSAASGLTIQQAIDIALKNNRSIKSAQLDLDKKKDLRDYAAIPVTFNPTSPSAASTSFLNLVAADISWTGAKKTLTATEDAIAYSTTSAYLNIIIAQESVSVKEKALAVAKWKASMSNVGLMAGTVSTYTNKQAQSAYQAALSNLKAAQNTLENAYLSFDKLLGINYEQKPQLSEKAQYSSLIITSLESEVNRAVDANPNLWAKDQAVTSANITLQLYNGSGSFEAKEKDVTKAQFSADESRDSARQRVRTLYNQIMKQESQYNAQMDKVSIAQDDLNVIKLKFDIGMATKAEVQDAEYTVQNETATLNSLIYQHELNKLVFEKPWVSSSAGATTSAAGADSSSAADADS